MPEVAPQPPLNNEELAAYHSKLAAARQSEAPEQRDTYIRPTDAWAHEASEEYIGHRMRHATESNEKLVAVRPSGEHRLSVDSLAADFERLSTFMREDVQALSGAIKDPASVRDRWWANFDDAARRGSYGWKPPKPRDSKDPLSLQEAKTFLEDRELEALGPKNGTEALRTVSLRATASLLESWKNKEYQGERRVPDDSEVELYMDALKLVVDESKPVGEQTYWGKKPSTLATHLQARREQTEQGFRNVHRHHLTQLGKAAADAAGVRQYLDKSPESREDPELSGLSRREQLDLLSDREVTRIMQSPDAVRAVFSRANQAFRARIYDPRKMDHESSPTDETGKQLELAEKERANFRRLSLFISRWQTETESGDSTASFGDYMSAAERRYQQELEAYVGRDIPDDVGRRMDEFEGAHRAYSGGESYSFSNTLRAQAYQYALQQLR